MNAPLSASSLFTAIEMAPRDPILGITEGFNADKNPGKTNLGVGVYYDDNGKVPLLECVKRRKLNWLPNWLRVLICRLMVWQRTTRQSKNWYLVPTARLFKRSVHSLCKLWAVLVH